MKQIPCFNLILWNSADRRQYWIVFRKWRKNWNWVRNEFLNKFMMASWENAVWHFLLSSFSNAIFLQLRALGGNLCDEDFQLSSFLCVAVGFLYRDIALSRNFTPSYSHPSNRYWSKSHGENSFIPAKSKR